LLASSPVSGQEPASAPAPVHSVMRRLLIVLSLCAVLLAPAAAHAQSGVNKLLIDACRDEHVDGHYTQAQFKKALEQLPADSDEYTACRQVIEDARLAQLANRGGSGGGGGGAGGGSAGTSTGSAPVAPGADPLASASPSERKALKAAGSGEPVSVGGRLVKPGALGIGGLSGSGRDVPAPLVVVVVLMAAGALGGGGRWLWKGVLARRFS
jgi:hypothetical protein